MRFEEIGKSHLILRLVQILVCLFMVMVFYNLGQYIHVPEIFKGAAEKDPGKPVLILTLDKSEYSVGEPIKYSNIILNDGNSDINFPVVLGDSELGFVTYFMTYVILTNEKGENLPFDIPCRLGSDCRVYHQAFQAYCAYRSSSNSCDDSTDTERIFWANGGRYNGWFGCSNSAHSIIFALIICILVWCQCTKGAEY